MTKQAWRAHDAVALIEDGARLPELLVDQGTADSFLNDGLRPWLLEERLQGGGNSADTPHAGWL